MWKGGWSFSVVATEFGHRWKCLREQKKFTIAEPVNSELYIWLCGKIVPGCYASSKATINTRRSVHWVFRSRSLTKLPIKPWSSSKCLITRSVRTLRTTLALYLPLWMPQKLPENKYEKRVIFGPMNTDKHAQRSWSPVNFWHTHSFDSHFFLSLKASGVFAEKNFSNDRLIIEKIPETRFELVQRGPDGNHFHIADLKLFVNGISVADCEDYSAKVAKLFRLQSSPEGYRRLNKISVIEPSEHPWTIFNDKANFTSGLLSIKNVQLTFFKDFGSTKVSVTEACLFLSNSLSLQWEVTTKGSMEAW